MPGFPTIMDTYSSGTISPNKFLLLLYDALTMVFYHSKRTVTNTVFLKLDRSHHNRTFMIMTASKTAGKKVFHKYTYTFLVMFSLIHITKIRQRHFKV